MSTQEKLLPCAFCGGEAELKYNGLHHFALCSACLSSTDRLNSEGDAISAWNRRASPPANAEPVAYLIEGNVSRTRYLQFEPEVAECDQPLVTVSKLYLASPPAAVPDGWVMVPATPTREMIIAHDELQNARGIPAFANSRDIWRAMISAAPAAPNGWQPIVKPMEWKDLSYDDSVLHKASWGEYSIIKDDRYELPYVLRPFIAGPSNFRTLEDAKAAVQADYERRILSALSAAPAAPDGWQPTYRHKKRGSTYRIEGYASLQTSTPCEETAVLVIYRSEDGRLWARPHDEFHDGRFERIPAAPTEASDE